MSGFCARCRRADACFGLGPPAQAEQQWFCGRCWDLHPTKQDDLARLCREMIEDKE